MTAHELNVKASAARKRLGEIETEPVPVGGVLGADAPVMARVATAAATRGAPSGALGLHSHTYDAALAGVSARHLPFLLTASGALSASLEPDAIADAITRQAVPYLADWAALHRFATPAVGSIGGGAGALETRARLQFQRAAHADPLQEAGSAALWRLALSVEPSMALTLEQLAQSDAPQIIHMGQTSHASHASQTSHAGHGSGGRHARPAPAQRDLPYLEVLRYLEFRSTILAPLRSPTSGALLGALLLARHGPRRFTASDTRVIGLFAGRAAQALEHAQLYAQAREALLSNATTVATAAHDLRTPLAVLKVRSAKLTEWLSGLRRGAPTDMERVSQGVESIGATTERIARMVSDLIETARDEAGAAEGATRRQVDVLALLRQVTGDAQQLSGAHMVELCASPRLVGDAPLVGAWDDEQVSRLLQNILMNAVKYSPEGGHVWVEVERATRPLGEEPPGVVIRVRDEGVGIPAGEEESVFEPFHRGSNSQGRFEGSGLGLARARQIARAHGGDVTVAPTLPGERGATLLVRLPLIP